MTIDIIRNSLTNRERHLKPDVLLRKKSILRRLVRGTGLSLEIIIKTLEKEYIKIIPLEIQEKKKELVHCYELRENFTRAIGSYIEQYLYDDTMFYPDGRFIFGDVADTEIGTYERVYMRNEQEISQLTQEIKQLEKLVNK